MTKTEKVFGVGLKNTKKLIYIDCSAKITFKRRHNVFCICLKTQLYESSLFPTVLKGFLFGLLPSLWLWVVVNAYLGKPLFNGFAAKGLVLPVIFNMVISGSCRGWYLARRIGSLLLFHYSGENMYYF